MSTELGADPERLGDVVLYEPALDAPMPALRSMSGPSELVADVWVSIMRGQFPEYFGIRSQRYLRMAISTLAATDRQATLADLSRLFTNPTYRQRLVAKLDNPLLVGEWAAFDLLSSAQQAEHVTPALSKVSEMISRRTVRAMLAQANPKMTLSRAVRQGKIVVVSLPPGVIGAPAAIMLGALSIFEIWQSVMARQAVPADKRPYVGLYLDEPAVLGSLPVPLDSLLETARGMNCGLTLATQSLSQLPDRVKQAALTNVASLVAFRPSKSDAALLAGELIDVTTEQLQQLPPFTSAVRLAGPTGVLRTTTVRTPVLPETTVTLAQVRHTSQQQFGIDPDVVDAQLRQRLEQVAASKDDQLPPLGEIGGRP